MNKPNYTAKTGVPAFDSAKGVVVPALAMLSAMNAPDSGIERVLPIGEGKGWGDWSASMTKTDGTVRFVDMRALWWHREHNADTPCFYSIVCKTTRPDGTVEFAGFVMSGGAAQRFALNYLVVGDYQEAVADTVLRIGATASEMLGLARSTDPADHDADDYGPPDYPFILEQALAHRAEYGIPAPTQVWWP